MKFAVKVIEREFGIERVYRSEDGLPQGFSFRELRNIYSSENIKKVNKSRLFLLINEQSNYNLPILASDTDNIIIYSNEVENFKKKKKKYNFFDLIKKQTDE